MNGWMELYICELTLGQNRDVVSFGLVTGFVKTNIDQWVTTIKLLTGELDKMLCWETLSPGFHVDVISTCTAHLNIAPVCAHLPRAVRQCHSVKSSQEQRQRALTQAINSDFANIPVLDRAGHQQRSGIHALVGQNCFYWHMKDLRSITQVVLLQWLIHVCQWDHWFLPF